jgi:DNA-binding phage protein
MTKNIKNKLSKHPYRGIISEVAREQGVTPQAIWNALYLVENPRITTIVARKAKARERSRRKAMEILESC